MGKSNEKGIFPLAGSLKLVADGTLRVVILMLLVFALHRALAWPYLSQELTSHHGSFIFIFLTGLASDLWLALLVGLVFMLLWLPFSAVLPGRWMNVVAAVWLLTWGLLTAAHQPYVEYFGFQFIPFHFQYLIDPDFMQASATSMVNLRSVILFCVSVMAAYILGRSLGKGVSASGKRLGITFLAFTALASGAHSANIHYRVQLFVPAELQMNFIERLYQHLKTEGMPEPLSPKEKEELAQILSVPLNVEKLDPMLRRESDGSESAPLMTALQKALKERVEAGRKPLLLTVLMESFRPVETGFYRNDPASPTPAFDALARSGVVFTRAYATSNVTRGGQEAVWCGYPSSVSTAMMRGRPDIKLACLPKLIAERRQPWQGETLWLHGGKGAFDSQRAFWHGQKVGRLMTEEDFPPDAPRTEWGVGDRAVVKAALEKLNAVQDSGRDYIFAMLLTVTNHIPWALPEDAPPELVGDKRFERHPSHLTTAYADQALADLVEGLKNQGRWNDTILVVVSDHGTQVEPYYDDVSPDSARHREALSHINLVLSGGMMSETLSHAGRVAPFVVERYVSQMDIASFWADLMGLETFRSFGESFLTVKERRAPLVSDFGPEIYFPQFKAAVARDDGLKVSATAKEDEAMGRLYFRAIHEWLNREAPWLTP